MHVGRLCLCDNAAWLHGELAARKHRLHPTEALLLEQPHIAGTIDVGDGDVHCAEPTLLHIIGVPARPQPVILLCLGQVVATGADLRHLGSVLRASVLPHRERHIRRVMHHVLASDILTQSKLQLAAIGSDMEHVHVTTIQHHIRRVRRAGAKCHREERARHNHQCFQVRHEGPLFTSP